MCIECRSSAARSVRVRFRLQPRSSPSWRLPAMVAGASAGVGCFRAWTHKRPLCIRSAGVGVRLAQPGGSCAFPATGVDRMPRARTTAGATAAAALGLLGGIAVAAQKPVNLQLTAGARVAVVNLLDGEVTHFHASRHVQNSFLKTYTVEWSVNAMLMEALRERLTQMGLVPVAAAATEPLRRAREACFLNAALAKGLPKACAPLFAQLSAAPSSLRASLTTHPPRSYSGNSRRRAPPVCAELPEYLRGWCVVSEARSEEGAADRLPA